MNCNVYDLVGVAFAQMTYDYDVLLMFGFRLRLVSNHPHQPQSLDEHLFDWVAFAMPGIVGRVRSHLTFQTSVNMTPQPVFGHLDKYILHEVIESVVSLGTKHQVQHFSTHSVSVSTSFQMLVNSTIQFQFHIVNHPRK